jgi:DNA-binding IclR family transcriptional regulator
MPASKSVSEAREPQLSEEARGSLARGLQILDYVADQGQARVNDIANTLDIPLSTAYRYLRQLREGGYLYDVDGYYCLGTKFQSGSERREAGHLVHVAAPILRTLTEFTGEASILTVRVQTSVLCLDRVMPPRRYLLSFQRGSIRPLYAGASATVLLAFAPDDVIRVVLNGEIKRFTSHSPSKESLPAKLATIREQGFAITYGEVDADMRAVAVPAFRGKTCVCAISVAGPANRMTDDRLDTIVGQALAAGRELGDRLDTVSGAVAWVGGEGL